MLNKKSQTKKKKYVLYNSTYIRKYKLTYNDRKQTSSCLCIGRGLEGQQGEWEEQEGGVTKGHEETFGSDE